MDDCLGKKKKRKSFLPPHYQDLLPNSVSILLRSSWRVLRAGCGIGMREGKQKPPAPEKPWHRRFSEPSANRKALASWGLSSSSPRENSDIVSLHGRIMGLNSCVTNFNTRGGCLKLKALLSKESAGRQHFNENYKQLLCT